MQPFVTDDLPLETIDWAEHLPAITAASTALAEFHAILQTIPHPDLLLAPTMTQEAVLSSRIEGTRATVEEVLSYDAAPNREVKNLADIEEVNNYRKALLHAVDGMKNSPLTLNIIREAHYMLLEGVRGDGKRRGEFRRDQNWIGRPGASVHQATYVPPSPIDLPANLSNFEKYLHYPEKDRLVQLAIIHGQFELIHPFLDGNGRIGRMLIPLFLYEKQLISYPAFYISAFFEAERDVYYDRLTALSTKRDWKGWIDYFLQAVHRQASANTGQVRAILELYNQTRQKLTNMIRSPALSRVVDYFFSQPIFKGADFTTQLGIPRTTGFRWLNQLTQHQLLTKTHAQSGRAGHIYRFDALIRLLGR